MSNEWIEISAKTVDDAITEGLVRLGTTTDKMDVEVLEKESSGFLGFIGKHDAKIRVRFKEVKESKPISMPQKKEVRQERPATVKAHTEAKSENKPVYFDIDDLVFDTVYTDQLSYTQGLSEKEKGNYDAGVRNYGKMLAACDGAITSTNQLKEELLKYQDIVLLNRNLASSELMEVSSCFIKDYNQQSQQVKIGYFSGSISHNENFELIKPALKKLLEAYPFIELHIVGHLDIPTDMKVYEQQIIVHDYVDWKTLPQLISQVDINLAPLVDSIFNRAKSEIKWLEAAMVKVPTIASDIGAFADMVIDGQTGLLAKENEWKEKLDSLIFSAELRQKLAENAYHFVLENCSLDNKDEMVTYFEKNKNNKS